jgi:hypothetical protein
MVYQTHLAEPSSSLQQSRRSDKVVDDLERMVSSYDSEESRSSFEEDVDIGQTLLSFSSSSYGSESTFEEDEVMGTISDNLRGDLDDPINAEAVEVVSEDSEDFDDGDEFDGVESEPSLVEDDKEDSAETVILLQHVIVRTDDGEAQCEEVEKESPGTDECEKKSRSFRYFRRHKRERSASFQGKKRRLSSRRSLVSALSTNKSKEKYCAESSTLLNVDSREDTEENTGTAFRSNKSPPKVKIHRGSQDVLASAIAMKKSREEKDEESNSSNDFDSREDTETFTEDPDYVASIDSSKCQTNGEWSKLANPPLSVASSDLSEGSSEAYPELIKSSRSVRSRRSLRSFIMLKRRQRGDAKSIQTKRDGEEDEGTAKTAKTNRSWFPQRKRKNTPKGEKSHKSKRSLSLFRKPVSLVECQRSELEWQIAVSSRLCCLLLVSHGVAENR